MPGVHQRTDLLIKIIIALLLILNGLTLYAQDEKWSVNAGVGNTEWYHVGGEYYFPRKNSIALSVGYGGLGDSKYYTFTFNHQYFLGSSKKYSGLPTWYIGDRIGMLYSSRVYFQYFNTNPEIGKSTEINLSLVGGRKFFISPTMGFNFDIGVDWRFLLKEELPVSIHQEYDPVDFLPEIRLQFFYRF